MAQNGTVQHLVHPFYFNVYWPSCLDRQRLDLFSDDREAELMQTCRRFAVRNESQDHLELRITGLRLARFIGRRDASQVNHYQDQLGRISRRQDDEFSACSTVDPDSRDRTVVNLNG